MIICLLICPNFSVVFRISVWTYCAVKRQLSKSHLLFCFLGYMEHYLSSELKKNKIHDAWFQKVECFFFVEKIYLEYRRANLT